MEAKGEAPKVINIMAALKESMQAKGRVKIKEGGTQAKRQVA